MITLSLLNVVNVEVKSDVFADDPALCKFLISGDEYVDDSDKNRSRIGKIRAVELLLRAGVSRDKLQSLRKSEKGRWFLPDSGMDFNVSHSHDFVVCAVSNNSMVGVDIEKYRPLDWNTFRDCFMRDEFTAIVGSRKSDQYFFNLWTKKESLLKAWGDGLSTDPANAIIEGDEGYIKGTTKRGYFHVIAVEGYSCVVCSTTPNQTVQIV